MTRTPRMATQDEERDSGYAPLTAEQAARWRLAQRTMSPWWVIVAQAVVGVLAALVAWWWTGRVPVAVSAAYGALSVLLPSVLFLRGLTGRLSGLGPSAAVLGFFVWEMVKLALTFAMLVAAPRLVPGLSWPALLFGLVLALKVYWVASLRRRKS